MDFSILPLAHCDMTQLSRLAFVDHTVTLDLTKMCKTVEVCFLCQEANIQ